MFIINVTCDLRCLMFTFKFSQDKMNIINVLNVSNVI